MASVGAESLYSDDPIDLPEKKIQVGSDLVTKMRSGQEETPNMSSVFETMAIASAVR